MCFIVQALAIAALRTPNEDQTQDGKKQAQMQLILHSNDHRSATTTPL